MRRIAVLALPLLLFLQTGCSDQPTSLEPDLTVSYKKPPKPPKPPPVGEPANPVIAYYGGGLWVADEDGSNKTMLYDPTGGLMPTWSPLGEGTASDPYEIFLVGLQIPTVARVRFYVDGGPPQVLEIDGALTTTTVNYSNSLAVSPDGQRIVGTTFHSDAWGGADPLILTDRTFTTETVIYNAPLDGSVRDLTWSGDGSKVAFFDKKTVDYPDDGELILKVLEIPDPLNLNDLPLEATVVWTFGGGYPEGMSWAPNADRLVFNIEGAMYLLDLEEVNGEMVASGPPVALGDGRGPVWSPEGDRILYDNRKFFIKSLAGGKDQRLPIGGRFGDWRRNPIQ